MTPFEVDLERELDVEAQRFAGEWLFKWHGLSYDSGIVDLDDFRGRRIRYEGRSDRYGGQKQQVFWDAIHRYLMQIVCGVFEQWESATSEYPKHVRLWSIDGAERSLKEFQVKIRQLSMDTDQRLRGRALPESVGYVAGPRGSVSSEIARLAEAHRSLLREDDKDKKPAPATIWTNIETFYADHRGLIWLVGLVVAGLGAAWRFLAS